MTDTDVKTPPEEDVQEIDEDEGQPDPRDLITTSGGGPGKDAVRRASKSSEAAEEMSVTERMDAVEWFMSDDPDESPAIRKLELNVSTDPDNPKYVEWIVQAIGRERIQEIRDAARKHGRGRKRRAQQSDDESDAGVRANLRIAAEGTVYPNLRDDQLRNLHGKQFLDPADVMNYRFRNKQGLIDQIAANVIEVSGYDEDDVQEIDAVGNS